MSPKNGPSTRTKNLALAAIAGQAGCVTVIIIVIALLIGFWLDAQTGRRGLFVIGLLILSVPFSLFAMVRIAVGAIERIQPPPVPQSDNRREDTSLTEEG